MSTNSVQLNSIGQIGVNVHDLEKATEFYRDTLAIMSEVPYSEE